MIQLNLKGPLYPAQIAADSKLPVRVEGDIEFWVREAGGQIFLLAAKREGATIQVKFSGLPVSVASGAVLYEEPRTVLASRCQAVRPTLYGHYMVIACTVAFSLAVVVLFGTLAGSMLPFLLRRLGQSDPPWNSAVTFKVMVFAII